MCYLLNKVGIEPATSKKSSPIKIFYPNDQNNQKMSDFIKKLNFYDFYLTEKSLLIHRQA